MYSLQSDVSRPGYLLKRHWWCFLYSQTLKVVLSFFVKSYLHVVIKYGFGWFSDCKQCAFSQFECSWGPEHDVEEHTVHWGSQDSILLIFRFFHRFHICILYITTKQLFEFKYEKYVTKEKIALQLQHQLLVTSQSNYLKIHNFDLSLSVKNIMCFCFF